MVKDFKEYLIQEKLFIALAHAGAIWDSNKLLSLLADSGGEQERSLPNACLHGISSQTGRMDHPEKCLASGTANLNDGSLGYAEKGLSQDVPATKGTDENPKG